MDNHVRTELAQIVRSARLAIQMQDHALTATALGWLIFFGMDWEAMQRQSTVATQVQTFRIRNHLINAYLRKALAWRNKPFAHVLPIETDTQEIDYA